MRHPKLTSEVFSGCCCCKINVNTGKKGRFCKPTEFLQKQSLSGYILIIFLNTESVRRLSRNK